MTWRPSLGVFTVSKAEAALPPSCLSGYARPPNRATLALISMAMLKHGIKLRSHIPPDQFFALLLTSYQIRGVYPFVLDPQDMKANLGLSCVPKEFFVSQYTANMFLYLYSSENAGRLKEVLDKILIGVTDEIAEELFHIGNAEERIPTLMSLLRLLAKRPADFSSASSDCSSLGRDTLSTFSYGFNQLKDVILWATVYHFLYRPEIYAELYAQFAEDFEFFGQPHLKMIEEIEKILPFQSITLQLAGDYNVLLAYYHAYKRGAFTKKDEEGCQKIRANLPELSEDPVALRVGRFSRLFSLSFDTVLSPEGHPTASLELKGVLDGFKTTQLKKPVYTRAFEAAVKKAKELAESS